MLHPQEVKLSAQYLQYYDCSMIKQGNLTCKHNKHDIKKHLSSAPLLQRLVFNHVCLQEDLSLTARLHFLSDSTSQERLMAVYGGIELAAALLGTDIK